MQPLGIRQNNPGNIIWPGYVLFAGMSQGEQGFAKFDTAEHGIAAIAQNLVAYQDRHGCRTVNQFIRRWSATDQDAYVANVCKALGVGPDDPIDIHNYLAQVGMVVAIIRQENGEQPYPDSLIASALGGSSTDSGQAPAMDKADVQRKAAEPIQVAPDMQTQGGPMADKDANPFATILSVAGPILTAINPIAGALVTAFTPLAQEKLANLINKHTDNPEVGQQVASGVIAAAQAITQKQDPAAAALAAVTDPAVAAQVEADALARLDKLTPLFDKLAGYQQSQWDAEKAGRDAAATRATTEKWDMTPWLVWFAGGTSTAMVVALAGSVVWQVLIQGKDPNAALLGLTGPLLMAAIACWKDIFAYRFDGNKESSATTAALTEMARSK